MRCHSPKIKFKKKMLCLRVYFIRGCLLTFETIYPLGHNGRVTRAPEFEHFAMSGAASSAPQNPGRELSAELLLNWLRGRQISGPSGKEDSDNKALQMQATP